MMTDTNETKKPDTSATYKKYAKHIGALFWARDTQWNGKDEYVHTYELIQVISLTRRWGGGRYLYLITPMETHRYDDPNDRTWKVEAALFVNRLVTGQYIPVDSNPVRPDSFSTYDYAGTNNHQSC